MSIEVYRASSSSLAAPPSRPRPLVSKTIYPAICLRGARNKSRLFYLERLHDFPPARLNLQQQLSDGNQNKQLVFSV